jgi:hypothetical protein
MSQRKRRIYHWRRISELGKGPRPKTWKWERHECGECRHVTRYKVYRTWSSGTPINYNTFIKRTLKQYSGAISDAFNAQRPMFQAFES